MPLIPELGRQRQEDFFNSRPAWSTEGAPGQPGIHRETQSSKKPQKKKYSKRYQGTHLKEKIIDTLLRKGYNYEHIKELLNREGALDDE